MRACTVHATQQQRHNKNAVMCQAHARRKAGGHGMEKGDMKGRGGGGWGRCSRGAVGNEAAAVKRQAVRDGTHTMLAHTIADVALSVATNAALVALEVAGTLQRR